MKTKTYGLPSFANTGFKNWPEICKIGRLDQLLMMVLATLDLSKTDDPIVSGLRSAFPQCFSDKKIQGPVPWSTLVADVTRSGSERGYTIARNIKQRMRELGTVEKFGLPYLVFALLDQQSTPGVWDEDVTDPSGYNYGAVDKPAEIPDESEVGTVVTWDGRDFVVVEDDGEPICSITVVPAECIALDL